MSLDIIPVNPDWIERNYDVAVTMVAHCFAGVDDGDVVAAGGLAWGKGRCFMFLRVDRPDPSYALPIVRYAKKLLKQARQFGDMAVYAPRDTSLSTSTKLLTLLGFQFHAMEPDEAGNEHEVWRAWLG